VTLAPTFDHASSLGRNETEEMRAHRLSTRDRRASVEAYAAKARSAFYGIENPQKTLSIRQMFESLVQLQPDDARFWAERAVAIVPGFFASLFERVPLQSITPNAGAFAQRMLLANQGMIREVALGR